MTTFPIHSLKVVHSVVVDESSGDMFNLVVTPTNAGEYSVNPATGVYTFGAVDAGLLVKIRYRSPSRLLAALSVIDRLATIDAGGDN